MNPEELLDKVYPAIYNRTCHSNASCWLGFCGGELSCLPEKDLPATFYKVTKLTAKQMNHGLTPAQWGRLRDRLFAKYKELGLCPQPLKH